MHAGHDRVFADYKPHHMWHAVERLPAYRAHHKPPVTGCKGRSFPQGVTPGAAR